MTKISRTPLHLRIGGVAISPALRKRIPVQLGKKLERYAQNVTRVTVRFEDLNGPRGGIDHACRIEMSVKGREHVVVEARAADASRAFQQASTKARAAITRLLARRGPALRRPLVSRAQRRHPAGEAPSKGGPSTKVSGRRRTREVTAQMTSWSHHAPKKRATRARKVSHHTS